MQHRDISIALAIGFVAFLMVLYTVFPPPEAFGQSAFYHGKTITLIQGRGPGGTGDLRVKAIVPLLQKYLPGESDNR